MTLNLFLSNISKKIEAAKSNDDMVEMHKLISNLYPVAKKTFSKEAEDNVRLVSKLIPLMNASNARKIESSVSSIEMLASGQIKFIMKDGSVKEISFYSLTEFLKSLQIDSHHPLFYLNLSFLMSPETFQTVQIYLSL